MKVFAFLVFAGLALGQVNIIVDDDCSSDYCPVVAPFKLWDQGKVNIIAIVTDTNNNYAAPVYRSHSIFYKRPTVPIYANLSGTPSNSQCSANNCNGSSSQLTSWATLVSIFDPGDVSTNYTPCLTGLRTQLAALVSAGKQTVYSATGFGTCLYQLMTSSADGISSLTGAQLIQQGVSKMVVCCGNYPNGIDPWNFYNDAADWSYIFANWTTQNGYPPIWMFSDQDATGTNFGPPSYAINTVNVELKQFQLLEFGNQREIWDEATVFLGYCGLSCDGVTYWADAGNGTMNVNSATNTPVNGNPLGYDSWSTATASGHHYVTNVASTTALSHLFDGYAYGFGFAALPPGANIGGYVSGAVTVSGAAGLQ